MRKCRFGKNGIGYERVYYPAEKFRGRGFAYRTCNSKGEREAQNAYIDSLQKMLTDITDSQESMNQADTDVVIADRVIIFGHLIGTDKQKVLQRIPRAEFIFDVNREIPSDTH